jgi:hypothetical protein
LTIRYCLGIEHPDIARVADPSHFEPLRERLRAELGDQNFDELQRLPSFTWTDRGKLESHLIAQLAFGSHEEAARFRESLSRSPTLAAAGFGPDPAISALESWSPVGSGGGIFGDRDGAESLTKTARLKDRAGKPVTGKGVNVVIVDRGVNRDWVQDTMARMALRHELKVDPYQPRVLGWTRREWTGSAENGKPRYLNPGARGSEHGHMITRNVLAIAPEAVIWDAPLLPPDNEPDAPPGPSSACQLFHLIKRDIQRGTVTSWDFRQNRLVDNEVSGPWVIVNAWGVMNPEVDIRFSDYADNPDNFLVNDMPRLDKAGIDVVFAAGNCGEPCPDRRCGSEDCGPGRSIFGLNAHPRVLTVGAVRSDGVPIAFSAQGPGRLAVKFYSNDEQARCKPDLCAPSHFRESDDAAELNTGTSAACGFAAGVIAALRSIAPDTEKLPPAMLRSVLRKTARRMGDVSGWDPRLGFGVIDATAAVDMVLEETAG